MRWRTAARAAVLERFAQFGLAGEDEGDGGAGIDVDIDHALDGGESGRGCMSNRISERISVLKVFSTI